MFNRNTLIIILTVLALCAAIFVPSATSNSASPCAEYYCFPPGASVSFNNGCLTTVLCFITKICTYVVCYTN